MKAKKLLSLLLALAMIFALAAAIHDICSGNVARQSYAENDLCKRFCEFIAHNRLRNQALP